MKFKLFYNKDRGLPEPLWGPRTKHLHRCPNCGGDDIHLSAHPDAPDDLLGESVRCGDCGSIEDSYEASVAYKRCWWKRIFRGLDG